ncbi:MAG: hypothetical protein ABL994_22435, partial [Verrucomicrobiales bacterium]
MARVSLNSGHLSVSLWSQGQWGEPSPIVTPYPILSFGEVVQNNPGLLAVEVRANSGGSPKVQVVVWQRDGSVDIIGQNSGWTTVSDLQITDSGFVVGRSVAAGNTESIFQWRKGDLITLPHPGQVKIKGVSENGQILEETLGLYSDGAWDSAVSPNFALGPYGELREHPVSPPSSSLVSYTRYRFVSEYGELIDGVSAQTFDTEGEVRGYSSRYLTLGQSYLITEAGTYLINETPTLDPQIESGGLFARFDGGIFSYTLPSGNVHHFDFDYDDDGFWDTLETEAGTDTADDTRFPGWNSNVVISDANRRGDFVGWIQTGGSEVDSATGFALP